VTVPHRVLADAAGVRQRIDELAAILSERHPPATSPGGVVLVGVLKGSVPFVADLARALSIAVRVDFVAVSAYRPDAGRVRLVKDLGIDVSGHAVVLVHDVVHTGLTTAYLVGELWRRGAASVEVCALVDRSGRRVVPVDVDHAGFRVGDEYVVGMGLDHAGRYRNLDALVAVDEAALDADPDALVGELYGRRRGGSAEALSGPAAGLSP
jgi:hypoxanthine phosphoribosyltransferase